MIKLKNIDPLSFYGPKTSAPGGGVGQTKIKMKVEPKVGGANTTSTGPSPPKTDPVSTNGSNTSGPPEPNKNGWITPAILIVGVGILIVAGIYLTKEDELNKSNN